MSWGQGTGLAVVVVVALVIAQRVVVAARRRRQVVDDLIRGMDALTAGRVPRSIPSRGGGRVALLARAFGEFAPQLDRRLATLEGDRQLLGAVLGGMSEGVIAVDGRRRLLFANQAAERLFGIGPGGVGKLVAELIRSPSVQDAVDATLVGPASHRAEIVIAEPRPLAGSRSLDVQGTPLPGSPPPGAVLVFHDVTDLRRLERMRQDFVANASHELKTPLAAIKAYTETLIDGALHDDEVNIRFLEQIDEQADRLNHLILDLLSLARLESGHDIFEHAPLELLDVARACVEAHRGRAEAKDLDYALESGCEDLWVLGDEEAVRPILENLIDNAIKYTPEGGKVHVSCRAEPDRVAIVVADTGIGIPREDLPRVFERFYRVDKARSREMGGTGLGLSIVKHLAHSLKGQIQVESRPGQGSVFTVLLPRLNPPA